MTCKDRCSHIPDFFRKFRFLPGLFFFVVTALLIVSVPRADAQILTRTADRMDEDRFNLRLLMYQFNSTTNNRIVNEYIIIPQIGLTRIVEFEGWIPLIKVTEYDLSPFTLGDLLLQLKVQLFKGWYKFPFVDKRDDTRYYLDLYMGFNTQTGPSSDLFNGTFFPYSLGIPDFRWGALWGSYTGSFEYFANFIYTMAAYKGETFFPLSKDLWNPQGSPPSYIFNIHKMFLKWLWPGQVFNDSPAPILDDYITYGFNIGYWLEIKPIIFKYKFFMELNGVQPFFPSHCLKKPSLDFTAGIIARLFKGGKITFGVSFPIIVADYTGSIFYFGVNFSL
jgi:hypothetical protein